MYRWWVGNRCLPFTIPIMHKPCQPCQSHSIGLLSESHGHTFMSALSEHLQLVTCFILRGLMATAGPRCSSRASESVYLCHCRVSVEMETWRLYLTRPTLAGETRTCSALAIRRWQFMIET